MKKNSIIASWHGPPFKSSNLALAASLGHSAKKEGQPCQMVKHMLTRFTNAVARCIQPAPCDMSDLITLRSPTSAELARAVFLFGKTPIPRQAAITVAVKQQPIERFVGAVAEWRENEYLRFHFGSQPGAAKADLLALLIHHLTSNANKPDLRWIAYGRLLAENEEPAGWLRDCGFTILRSERFFQLPAELAESRVREILHKYKAQIPATWHTESIRHHPVESILNLIAPHRLMTTAELQACWRPLSANGFDPDLSSILFDGQTAFGTLLARRSQDLLYYDIRVVRHPHPRLRALGNLCLFHHCITHHDLSNPVRTLLFRGGEMEHRETANLAFRMGGTELPARHLYGKELAGRPYHPAPSGPGPNDLAGLL